MHSLVNGWGWRGGGGGGSGYTQSFVVIKRVKAENGVLLLQEVLSKVVFVM